MTSKKAQELLDKIEHATYWSLRGGNDPEDRGNVIAAVDELAEVVKESSE